MIKLKTEEWEVVLLEKGSYIASVNHIFNGVSYPVFRPLNPLYAQYENAHDMASYNLLPFSNIAPPFPWPNGQIVALPPNIEGIKYAIHGHGFQRQWALESEPSNNNVQMSYTYKSRKRPSGARTINYWPASYKGWHKIKLFPDRMIRSLGIKNLSRYLAPGAMGLHDHLMKIEGMTIRTGLQGVWQSVNRIPTKLDLLPAMINGQLLDFTPQTEFRIDQIVVDHCFTGWNGDATVTWPGYPFRLRILAKEINNVVMYVPENGDFAAFEAVENMTDGFNHIDLNHIDEYKSMHGVHIYKPGEERNITVEYIIEPVDPSL